MGAKNHVRFIWNVNIGTRNDPNVFSLSTVYFWSAGSVIGVYVMGIRKGETVPTKAMACGAGSCSRNNKLITMKNALRLFMSGMA